MSGFCGVIEPPSQETDAVRLDAMASRLTARGPDGLRLHRAGRVGLAHALLRQTEEDARDDQPLSFDSECWIVGDARIDDRGSLIDSLCQAGRSANHALPDSALILHAWYVWGERCVERLIGDFAFAIWDRRQDQLFCARDQFGVVPFYHARAGDALLFGNDVRALLADGRLDQTLNQATIGDYLMVGFSADPAAGFFAAIDRLPPAHAMSFRHGTVRRWRYWQPKDAEPDMRTSREEVIERFRHVLGLAVSDRLRGSPVALSLSGGVDSTLVAGIATRQAGAESLHAWSNGFDWLVPDAERPLAEAVARHLGIRYHPLSSDNDFLRPGVRRWSTVPEPRFEIRRTPGHHLAEQMVAGGHRVMLTGLGGDTIAAASTARWANMLMTGQFARFARDGWHHYRSAGRRMPLRASCRQWLSARRPPPLPQSINRDFAAEQHLGERLAELHSVLLLSDPRLGMTSLSYWSELLSALHPGSTGLPLRMRHPFFDVRLLTETLRLPPVPWLERKSILRAAGEGIVPDVIRTRRKTPMSANPFWEAARRGDEPWLVDFPASEELEPYCDIAKLREAAHSIESIGPARYLRELLIPAGFLAWMRRNAVPQWS